MGSSQKSSIGASGGKVDHSIDIDAIVELCTVEGERNGWEVEILGVTEDLNLVAMRREGEANSKRLYISAGMHGDEPAPLLAVLRLLKRDVWPRDLDICLCPCLNPGGFRRAQRENEKGVDLNRQYHLPDNAQPETAKHIEWLDRQERFDVAMCLHEDWESWGFYMYELLRDEGDSFASEILDSVKGASSIDCSDQIDGMAAKGGVIAPRGDYGNMMDEWPEAIWLMEKKADVCYTFETSSADPLILRVAALVKAVNAVARSLAGK